MTNPDDLPAKITELRTNFGFLVAAAAEFPEIGYTDSESYSEALLAGQKLDAKQFFACKSLGLLLEVAASCRMWCDYLQNPWSTSPVERQICSNAIHRDQEAVKRNLHELLAKIIRFKETNQLQFYEHFLLLTDLQQHLTRCQDDREFFGHELHGGNVRCDALRQKTLDLEKTEPELSAAWYAKTGKGRLSVASMVFRSARQIQLQGFPSMSAAERAALGFTFAVIYDRSSHWLHFTPSRIYSPGKPTMMDVISNAWHCFGMSWAMLMTMIDLIGQPPGPQSQALWDEYQKHDALANQGLANMLHKPFEAGDIVQIGDSLAEVLELEHAKSGYHAIHIRTIAGHNVGSETWADTTALIHFVPVSERQAFRQAHNLPALTSADKDDPEAVCRKIAIVGWTHLRNLAAG